RRGGGGDDRAPWLHVRRGRTRADEALHPRDRGAGLVRRQVLPVLSRSGAGWRGPPAPLPLGPAPYPPPPPPHSPSPLAPCAPRPAATVLGLSASAQELRERPGAAASSIVIVQNASVRDPDETAGTPLVADGVDSVTIAVAIRYGSGKPIADLRVRIDVTGS